MGWDGKERRATKRYGIKNSTVIFRKGGLLALLKPPSFTYLLLNIGLGGCNFICKEDIAVGKKLLLTIDAPGAKGSVRAWGRVLWSRRSQDQDAVHLGIQFSPLGGRSASILKNLLDGAILENIDISTRAYMKQIEKL